MDIQPRNISSIAAHFCELSDWTLSNLQLQKIVYIAQMISVAERNCELIKQPFEAWQYGPVVSSLYQKLKIYGANVVPEDALKTQKITDDEWAFIQRIYNIVGRRSSAELIHITHWKKGAWYKHFYADSSLPHNARSIGSWITLESMQAEYDERKNKPRQRTG